MAGPIRISVLANASRARSELTGTQSDLRDLGQAGDRASTQLRSSLSQAGTVFARLRQEAESNLDRIPKDAAGAIDKTSAEFQALSPEMRRAVQDAARVASNELRAGAFGQAGEQAGEDAGEGFASSLTSKVKSAGPALAGAFAALGVGKLFADALDQDAGTDRLAASLGATPREAQNYGRLAGKLYSEAFGENVGDIRTAIGAVQGNFRNLDGGALEDVTRRALTFADVFEVDVARASQVAGQAVRTGLAKNATEAFDLLTAASQKVPPSLREDVLDAADEYGGFFKQIGYDGEQAFSVLARGAGKGMYGIDKAGDAVKEFSILVTTDLARTKPAIEGLGLDYDDMANSLLAGGGKARKATNEIIDGVLSIQSPSKRARTAVELFGTPLEDLGTNQIPGFLRSLKSAGDGLGDFEGATDKAGKTAYDNAQSQFKAFGRGLQQDVTQKIVDALPEIRATARELEETFGPALKTIGGLAATAAKGFAQLPGPVKAFAGAVGLAALALPRMLSATRGISGAVGTFGSRMATAGAGTASFVTGIRNAETRATTARNAMTRMGGAARGAAGIGGLGLLAAGASTSNDKLKTLANVGGGAMLGFSVAGPIGAAIGGGAGLLLSLGQNAAKSGDQVKTSAQKAKEAASSYEDYAASLDSVTAATSESTKQIAFNTLESAGAIDAANLLGFSTRQIINGVTGQVGARKRLRLAIVGEQQAINALNRAGGNTQARQEALDLIRAETGVVADSVKRKREEIAATRDYSGALRGLPRRLKTSIEQDGIEPSLRNIARLRDRYDLTPKQVRTLIKATGFADTEKGARRVQRQLEGVGRARPNLRPYESATRRSMLRTERTVERGTRAANRSLRSGARGTQRWMDPFNRGTRSGVGAADRTTRRGAQAVRRNLGQAGRTRANTRPWELDLSRGVAAGRRNASRGGRDVADQLSRGPSRAKPNLRGYTGAINRGVSDGVRTGRRGGSDVARGMTDPVNRARPNLSGYVDGVRSGVGSARSVGSSGGNDVGGALKAGIIAGFSGTASALASQAANAVRGAINAAKREAAIRSPSKKMEKVGRQLGDGIPVGLAKTRRKGNAAARKLMRSIIAAAGNDLGSLKARLEAYGKASDRSEKRVRGVIRALGRQSKALINARNAEQKLEARVKAASAALKQAIATRDEYAKSVRDSVVQFGNVTSFEEGHLNSTDSFLVQLRERAAEAAKFAAVVNDLKKRGLNATSLRQILEAGPEAGRAAAEAIAAGGAGAIKEVNSLTTQLGQTGKTLGDGMAAGFYNAGIKAKNKLLQGLEDKERTAEKRANRLAQSLLKAFRKRLDIGASGGGKKGGKNKNHAASALLGDEDLGRAQAERYGRMLAQGVNTGYAAASKTVAKPTSAKPAAAAKATAVAPMRVRVDITPNEALNAAAAGRTITKWVDAYQDSAIGGRRS